MLLHTIHYVFMIGQLRLNHVVVILHTLVVFFLSFYTFNAFNNIFAELYQILYILLTQRQCNLVVNNFTKGRLDVCDLLPTQI